MNQERPKSITLLEIFQKEYKCPITHSEIVDPVLTVDGHTYERTAIENWLKTSNKSPVTNAQLASKQLISNISLKNLIQKISYHLPIQFEAMNDLQIGNSHLEDEISELNQNLEYFKQKCEDEQQNGVKLMRQKKKQEKMIEVKNIQLNSMKKKIFKLEKELKQYRAKQFNWKEHESNLRHQYESKINTSEILKEKIIQNHKQDIKNKIKVYKHIEVDMSQFLMRYVVMACLMISELQKAQENSTNIQTTRCINEILKNVKKELKRIQKEHEVQDFLKIFQTQEYLIKTLQIKNICIHSTGLSLQKYQALNRQFAGVFPCIHIRDLIKIMQKWQTKKNRTRIEQNLIGLIRGVRGISNQQDWQLVINAQNYKWNFQILDFYGNQNLQINSEGLRNFQSLIYVNVAHLDLTHESQLELKKFEVQNPHVIVAYENDEDISSQQQGMDMQIGQYERISLQNEEV